MSALELDWTAEIAVAEHASKRGVERLGWGQPAIIAAEIRSAILQGRWSIRRPSWTRGNGRAEFEETGLSRYVWNQEATHCWVIVLGSSGTIHVRTLLLDHHIKQEEAGRLRLLGGRDA